MLKKSFGFVLSLFIVLAGSLQAQYTVLHSFTGTATDGRYLYGNLVLGGKVLYGMTETGGASNYGTIFKINKDGTGFALLHSFANNGVDGNRPLGTLLLKGKTLYGFTDQGGANKKGTIFKIQTNGTGYALLHTFAGGALDGNGPVGALVAKGQTLYGMTILGGASDLGTAFKIRTDGTGFALLHSFTNGTADGGVPQRGALVFKGSKLYGMTSCGGASGLGVLFRMNLDGSGFTVLHSFMNAADGGYPMGSVFIKGKVIYGMTIGAGINNCGVLFKANIDGTGFAVLHAFSSATTDGCYPYGTPIIKGSLLYGLTCGGGAKNLGTLFQFNLKAASFRILHSFQGAPAEGENPLHSLLWKNGVFYGTTYLGGTADRGTVFSYSTK